MSAKRAIVFFCLVCVMGSAAHAYNVTAAEQRRTAIGTFGAESLDQAIGGAGIEAVLEESSSNTATVLGYSGLASLRDCGTTFNDRSVRIWGGGGYGYYDRNGSAPFDGGLTSAAAGVDKRFGKALLGLAIGGEWANFDTINGGKYKYSGFSVAPYFAWKLTDSVVVDLKAAVTWMDNDVRDWLGMGLPIYQTASYDSWRFFTSGGIAKFWDCGAWTFRGRLGAFYVYHNRSDYVTAQAYSGESNDLFQLRASARAIYNNLGSVKPFVGVVYKQDVARSSRHARMTGFDVETGIKWQAGRAFVDVVGFYGRYPDTNKVGGAVCFGLDF